ncbi:MAG: hypothetical protein R6X02_02530 [Enhygromyxa sp.]
MRRLDLRFSRESPAKSLLSLGLLTALAAPGCRDDTPAADTTAETSGDGDGDPSTGDGDGDPSTGDGDGDPSTGDGDGDPSTGDGDGEGDKDPYPGVPPQLYCPGHPAGNCDELEGAPLRVGTAVVDLVPKCFESWIDVAGNGTYNAGEDDFIDCGCDRLCPADANYPGPDEGEGDGVFQRIFMAGFQNNRPARGVRGADVGLPGVGEGDGIWARAIVLDQGNTRVAIVTIDTVGYFWDEVAAIRPLIASQQVDYLVVQAVHNHEGPDTMGLWGEQLLSGGFDPDYRAQVRLAISQAVTAAVGDLEEVATLTVGRGDASQANAGDPNKGIRNVNNDTRDPFVVDEAVDVLHFANAEGQTLATMINYASHPEALSSSNSLLTSDYVHALRRTLELGSQWETAPDKPGLGGTSIFLSGALGGMMTPLGIQTVSPDGETWSSGEFEMADTIGQLIGEIALDAIANGEVIQAPQLQFAAQPFLVEVKNDAFKLLFNQGVFDREIVEMDNKQYVRSEMGVIELGPVRMLTVPGELLPELAVGGYDGSQMFTSEVELIDPNNPNPPKLAEAPEGPYLKERIGSPYTWIIGLGNDELGYIIPEYDFVLGFPAYISEAAGDHYEETNSIGPHMAGIVFQRGDALIDFIDWL